MTPEHVQKIADAARAAFAAREHVQLLEQQNVPVDFKEREQAFVALSIARAVAAEAYIKLREAML